MIRRGFLAVPALAGLLALGTVACQGGGPAAAPTAVAATPSSQDLKTTAGTLQQRVQTTIDAINAKDTAGITKAKSDLNAATDKAEDQLQSQTGPTANLVNSAVSNIRAGMTNNDVNRLTRAKEQLQQAQQS